MIMDPTRELTNAIYREHMLRRRTPIETKVLTDSGLFDLSGGVTCDGMRRPNPEIGSIPEGMTIPSSTRLALAPI